MSAIIKLEFGEVKSMLRLVFIPTIIDVHSSKMEIHEIEDEYIA